MRYRACGRFYVLWAQLDSVVLQNGCGPPDSGRYERVFIWGSLVAVCRMGGDGETVTQKDSGSREKQLSQPGLSFASLCHVILGKALILMTPVYLKFEDSARIWLTLECLNSPICEVVGQEVWSNMINIFLEDLGKDSDFSINITLIIEQNTKFTCNFKVN